MLRNWKGKKNKKYRSILAAWPNRSSQGHGAPKLGFRAGGVPGRGLPRKVWAQEPRQEFHRNIGGDLRRQDVKSVSPSIGAPNCPVEKGHGELVFPNLNLHVCSGIHPARMESTQGRSRSIRVRRGRISQTQVRDTQKLFQNSMLRHPKAEERTSAVKVWDRNGTLASQQIWPKRILERQMQRELSQASPKQVQSKPHVVGSHNMSQWECTVTGKKKRK